MLERWMQGVLLGKRLTSEEHVIGLENGKVVRTRKVRPKSGRHGSEHVYLAVQGRSQICV